jgi:hypothetical protein
LFTSINSTGMCVRTWYRVTGTSNGLRTTTKIETSDPASVCPLDVDTSRVRLPRTGDFISRGAAPRDDAASNSSSLPIVQAFHAPSADANRDPDIALAHGPRDLPKLPKGSSAAAGVKRSQHHRPRRRGRRRIDETVGMIEKGHSAATTRSRSTTLRAAGLFSWGTAGAQRRCPQSAAPRRKEP